MTPSEIYHQYTQEHGYVSDPAQTLAVIYLDELHSRLLRRHNQPQSLKSSIIKIIGKSESIPVTGLYIWGGVGRGKTWLMDILHEALPIESKIRIHFHHFMQTIHAELQQLSHQRNPLAIVAERFSKRYTVLCLDEFHVTDITDAMLLSGLLKELFAYNITLIATSNREPDDLYKNGLQRDRFLPAIDLIKTHTQAIHVNGECDHRLRLLEQSATWYCPFDNETQQTLLLRFQELAPGKAIEHENLHINHRTIPTIMCHNDVVWFDFNALCDGPRASADYIELAKRFHTIFISSIPIMDESSDDKARRFINMIDEFYDRNVILIMSAESEPDDLYQGRQLAFPFQRTTSRLKEMRSRKYQAGAHKP